MTKRKTVFSIIFLVAVGTGAAWALGLLHRSDTGQTLKLYGNVDIRQVNLSFRVGGRVAKMNFEEGDRVKAGDCVALLDSVPFEDDVRLAKANLDQAAATLAKYEAGNRPQEIAAAKASVDAREAALQLAIKELQRGVPLLPSGAISKSNYDTLETNKTRAEADLASARESLSLMQAGFRQEEINAARAAFHAAEANLALAETRLADTKLLAPSDGVILTRVVEPGAMVAAGQTVSTLSLTEIVWVRAYVGEKDLGLIYPGMPAEIYTDTAPQKPYIGHIGFISPEAEFTPKSVETPELRTALVYRLRIIAADPDHGLRQGMPVTVHLHPGDAPHNNAAQKGASQ